jgi:hypothetical protein
MGKLPEEKVIHRRERRKMRKGDKNGSRTQEI